MKQQEVFCQHYVLSRNGTESAKQAGYSNPLLQLIRHLDYFNEEKILRLRIRRLTEGTFTTEY